MMEVYRFKNHVYLPTLKNANTFYKNCFISLNWKKVSFDSVKFDDNVNFFSYIQNPEVRHAKGVAEFLSLISVEYSDRFPKLMQQMETHYLAEILSIGCYDNHSLPITFIWREVLDKIHWIPLDLTINDQFFASEDLTRRYLAQNNIPFLDNFDNFYRNPSNATLKKWHGIIMKHKKNLASLDAVNNAVYTYLNDDVVLYHRVIDSYRHRYLYDYENF